MRLKPAILITFFIIVINAYAYAARAANITVTIYDNVVFNTTVSVGTPQYMYQDVVLVYPNITLGFTKSYADTLIVPAAITIYHVSPINMSMMISPLYSFVTNYTFTLLCSRPVDDHVNVTVVLRGWGYIYNYTIAGSNWFILYALQNNVPMVTVYPSGFWDVNVTTLVVTVYNVQVQEGQSSLCVPLTYTTITGEKVNTTICCTISWAIVVAVPSYITTYTPNVTVKGYVQDMYTGKLLPGIPIRIYVDGQYYTTVTTDETGHFSVTFYFEQPGRHVVQYYWYDQLEATEYIDYVGVPGVEQAYATATQAINLIQRVIPAAPPVLALPRPSLTNTMTILVAGFVAALWAWMAREVDVSYATLIAGFILVAIGLLTRNYYLITPGAVALALAPVLRRLSG